MLAKLDAAAAHVIHANDVSKLIRAIEVSLAAEQPLTEQWQKGRDALTGYRILRLGLDPGRERLYERINQRAAEMFDLGLVEETERLVERFGYECRRSHLSAMPKPSRSCAANAPGRRRSRMHSRDTGTTPSGRVRGFRRDREINWLQGCGSDSEIFSQARPISTDGWTRNIDVITASEKGLRSEV